MTRWTEEQFQAHTLRQSTPKKAKYGNIKTEVDGVVFDSLKEASRWSDLKLLEASGQISELRRQVVFELVPSVILDGRRKPPLRYIADATYIENGKLVIEDTKSEVTRKKDTYRIKKHLVRHIHGIEIKET